MHGLYDWRMTFHPADLLPEALGQLDLYFAWTCPIWWGGGAFAPVLLAVMAVLAWRFVSWRTGAALGVVFPILVIALAFPKLHDGFDSVFFAYSRSLLAMPLLLAWGLSLFSWKGRAARWVVPCMFLLAPVYLVFKTVRTCDTIGDQMSGLSVLPVQEYTRQQFLLDAAELASVASNTHADLIVGLNGPAEQHAMLMCYGAPIENRDLPPTLYVGKDRRYWRREEEAPAIHRTMLCIGGSEEEWYALRSMHHDIIRVGSGRQMMHVVRNNHLTTEELLELLGRSM